MGNMQALLNMLACLESYSFMSRRQTMQLTCTHRRAGRSASLPHVGAGWQARWS